MHYSPHRIFAEDTSPRVICVFNSIDPLNSKVFQGMKAIVCASLPSAFAQLVFLLASYGTPFAKQVTKWVLE